MASPEPDIKIPPSSQSHFAKFENFAPDDDAPFENEFARLAASQEWVPGSQEYAKERTIAMRSELKSHFFKSSQDPENALATITEEDELEGYQALCDEVDLPRYDTTGECKKALKKTLVNIVDLIDTRRTSAKVKVWQDFAQFRDYTLQEGHMINRKEAKEDGGYLASLLQKLFTERRGRNRRRGGRGAGGRKSDKVSGRVVKRERK
ncbi:hypothetical protein A9K55_005730 [Cordyceps militaris]|uniref:Uncharacterized protein n=1 Tax=Cordyceps militaris TaxID=73501 RepID=A0A2H4SA10_CORMI|nr:hypothetical protein A9K55_005730 [Cordyceps militaris]